VTEYAIPAPVNRILIDDFSIGKLQTNLGRLIGGGWWYSVADGNRGNGESSVQYGVVNGPECWSGQSMRANFYMGTRLGYAWAIMGFYLSTSSNVFNLSSMQALSFYAKGQGTIQVRLFSTLLDTLSGNDDQFSYNLASPSEWTHITIPIDSFRLAENSVAMRKGITWEQVAPSIQIIYFMASAPSISNLGESITLWLDDIALEGVGLETFVPK
jgi:hypothetical protein